MERWQERYPGQRHVARFWGHHSNFYEDKPEAEVIKAFNGGAKNVVTGPSVDDYDPEAEPLATGTGWCAPSP